MLAVTDELAKKYGSRDGLDPKGPLRQASLVPTKCESQPGLKKRMLTISALALSVTFPWTSQMC